MSPPITSLPKQLILNMNPELTDRYRCLRDVVAQGVYQRGLKRVAADLDMAPGNLSVALADRERGEHTRKFGVDDLEDYISKTGDTSPVLYLVEKFLGDQAAARDDALAQVKALLLNLPGALAAAGLVDKKASK
jgi:hypothetical protein